MDDLIYKTPMEIACSVRNTIDVAGKGGGYILSSSNSLTNNMKVENIMAIKEALAVYGTQEN